MLQEELLHSLRFLFADLEVVRRIQVDQREGFHRALHVKAVPMDHLASFGTSLFGSASVQFNAVPQDPFVRGDFSERSTIPDAGIERTTLFVRECQESTDPLRLWDWKGVEPQTLTSCKTHWMPPACDFQKMCDLKRAVLNHDPCRPWPKARASNSGT